MHELTTRTLKFVTELLHYLSAAGTVLRTDIGSPHAGLSWLDGEGAEALLGDWLHGGELVFVPARTETCSEGKNDV